uniref:Uncharacterized protein n=1 Tax=Cucumis melo TaxID=3656 RepID=A0A9I9DRN0_CUCME
MAFLTHPIVAIYIKKHQERISGHIEDCRTTGRKKCVRRGMKRHRERIARRSHEATSREDCLDAAM